MNKKNEQLKNLLIKELRNNSPDLYKVQELLFQLTDLDRDTIRFSVDAGIIDRLGRELVAKQETAVSELVKNAYDADSTVADLVFIDSNKPGGTLLVKDNGHGMSRYELVNGFMRISSTDKIHNPISPRYKRQRAGRKGIGRFAVQRLGNKLSIITKREEQEKALKVNINWDNFQNDRDLLSIRNPIEEIEPEDDRKSGTILIIQGLRESWSETSIKRIYKYIVDLVQPFPLSDERKALEDREDPGFKANFYAKINNQPQLIVDEEIFIYSYALAIIEGHIDRTGQGYWSLISDKLDFKCNDVKIGREKDKPETRFEHLHNIYLKAYYFIYEPNLIPPQQLSRIRRLADDKGGIRLYRNGFRVLPYGESNDDWLQLDYSVRRRQILPPHGNNNFFGFIEITDFESKKFEETSSREGLIENDAMKELKNFAHRVLISSVLKTSELRERKATTSQRDYKKEKRPQEIIRKAVETLSEIANKYTDEISKTESAEIKKDKFAQQVTLQEISRELDEAAKVVHSKMEEESMLRVLASLGLVIGEFTHETRFLIDALRLQTNEINKFLQYSHDAQKLSEKFIRNIESLRNYTSYYDATVAHSINRQLKPLELRDIINEFIKAVKPGSKRLAIDILEPQISGFHLFTKPMHISEWGSVLLNLYTNAIKAIRRVNREGKILIRAGKNGELLYLEFADNGDGIPEENKDKIFEPFFTTTSPMGPFSTDEHDDIIGTGLGLKIVKDIITSYGGRILLVTPPDSFATCFRIEIPKAKKEEIEKNDY